MSDVTTLYFSTPPVARTVATVVFLASVAVYTGMLSIHGFFFHYSMLLKFPPAIHRFATSFLITSKDLGVLFDTYFVYTYLSQIERNNAKFAKKEDLLWYLMFVGGVIILVNQLLTGAVLYLHALLIAICYTATQDQRGMQAHFYVVTVPAQLMPWCMLLAQLLFSGWGSFMLGLTGIFAAHLHDFLTRIYPEFGRGANLIPTPSFLSWVIRNPRVRNTGFGTSYAPPIDNSGRGGPLPDSWRAKGPGRRLG
ncbi:Der1-like family protein [Xylaria castorea]|nr:Der1-like family protein [Xylaria castorea]